MTPQVDGATVRRFIEIISGYAGQAINGASQTGYLQLLPH
jgi:hypothetical protein